VRKDFIAGYDSIDPYTGHSLVRLFILPMILICLAQNAIAQGYRSVVITRHGGPEVLQLQQHPTLPEPAASEVRLRVLTASASFTDIMVREGSYPGIDAELPYAPGYDLVGVVDKIGTNVSELKVGDRVADLTIWGAYSEYVVRPAAGLVPLPDAISDEQAVAIILSYTTAYQMLYRVANVEAGQRILIHGASGAVGTALAQLGRMSGLTMYGTASSAKQDYVAALGVTPIDYQTEDFVSRIHQETGGGGVDAVFDAIGVDNFRRSYASLAPDGVLVTYGLYQASLAAREDSMAVVWEFLGWQWQMLKWKLLPDEEKRVDSYTIADLRKEQPQWFRDDVASLFDLLGERTIDPQIWKVMPLEEAAQAQEYIANGKVRGKIVLRVSEQ
jgi:NADPH:quinone reductase-like Zn-dependent oxidoreductase